MYTPAQALDAIQFCSVLFFILSASHFKINWRNVVCFIFNTLFTSEPIQITLNKMNKNEIKLKEWQKWNSNGENNELLIIPYVENFVYVYLTRWWVCLFDLYSIMCELRIVSFQKWAIMCLAALLIQIQSYAVFLIFFSRMFAARNINTIFIDCRIHFVSQQNSNSLSNFA